MARQAVLVDRLHIRPVRETRGVRWKLYGHGPEGRRSRHQRRGEKHTSRDGDEFHSGVPQAKVTGKRSTTLRMKPDGFQFDVSGCTSPLVLVQRTAKSAGPAAPMTIRAVQIRKL